MKLRLGPLPSAEVVKITVTLPLPLKQQLDQYAEVHAATFGMPVDTQALIPWMLTLFMRNDRAFQRALKTKRGKDAAPR